MSKLLSRSKVWAVIAPAMPDSLENLGNGQYLAKWWKPVLMQDVETLLQIEGITIHEKPYEPRNLPEGLAVRFSVKTKTKLDHINAEVVRIEASRQSNETLKKTGT